MSQLVAERMSWEDLALTVVARFFGSRNPISIRIVNSCRNRVNQPNKSCLTSGWSDTIALFASLIFHLHILFHTTLRWSVDEPTLNPINRLPEIPTLSQQSLRLRQDYLQLRHHLQLVLL